VISLLAFLTAALHACPMRDVAHTTHASGLGLLAYRQLYALHGFHEGHVHYACFRDPERTHDVRESVLVLTRFQRTIRRGTEPAGVSVRGSGVTVVLQWC
jgi:hypothetical protein